MMKTFRPPADCAAPETLATLAANLVRCTHPPSRHVRSSVREDDPRLVWCTECGALQIGGSPPSWQAPNLTARLTREHFERFALLLHAIEQLSQLAQSHAPAGSAASREAPPHRSLRISLVQLARLPLVRSVDRLEEAIARMPSVPLVAQTISA